MMIPKNCYHFSIDDVFEVLIEVTDQKIGLFEHPFFAFLKELHKKFGCTMSLYVFYRQNINGKLRTLEEVAALQDQLSSEPWLFFGPHALDYQHPPYSQAVPEQTETFEKIYGQLDRLAGRERFSQFVRLQYYSESFELADYFRDKGVKALFTTDKAVGSYRMPAEVAAGLVAQGHSHHQGMAFIRTHFRVEFFVDDKLKKMQVEEKFKAAFEQYGFLIFYTHEIEFMSAAGRAMAVLMFEAAKQLGLNSVEHP